MKGRGLPLALLALLPLYAFIRGLSGSGLGDIAATGLFVLAPTTAEAIGWFGGSSLIGLAMTLIALRLIADVVWEPGILRSAGAAIAVAAVAVSHPFSLVFLGIRACAHVTLKVGHITQQQGCDSQTADVGAIRVNKSRSILIEVHLTGSMVI